MPRGDLGYIVKTFFDSPAVIKKLPPAKRKAFTRAGALVRTIAKRSIRPARRKPLSAMSAQERKAWTRRLARARKQGKPRPKRAFESARPGDPPRNKTGFLRKFIFYGWDPGAETVYVGPTPVGNLRTAWLLEHGGHAALPLYGGKRVPMRYRGNPFMKPALETAAPQIADLFRNVITK